MKILLLAPFDLFPPIHGGSSIVYNFIKHAAAQHDINALISHLYSLKGYDAASFDQKQTARLAPHPSEQSLLGDNVHIHYCNPSIFDRLKVLSFLINPYYYRAADRICRQSQPHVIQCEILWPILVGWYLRRKYKIPLVWVEHNIEALKFTELERPRAVLPLVRALERFACQHADHIITLSEVDRDHLMELYGVPAERISVIRPSPDLSDFTWNERDRAEIRKRYSLGQDDILLTFVGNMKYEPNEQAVHRIAEYIYPTVIAKYPNAKFVIIGQGAAHLTNCQRDNIIFTGYVSRQELVAHLSATDIFLVPVESGSGIRVKILEATACARAVVATRKAAEGLEFFADDELVRVEAVDQRFIDAVLRLIQNPTLRNHIGARAQRRTRHEFGWQKTLAAYEEVYNKVGAGTQMLQSL